METGKYKAKAVDFSAFSCRKFPLTLFSSATAVLYGCGANCLSTLTGEEPGAIASRNKYNPHYSDKFMVSYLKKRDFKVVPLTVCGLTGSSDLINNVKSNHVILISSMFKKFEASWSILYDGYMIHNQDIVAPSVLEFINRPILTAYVVFREDWR